MVQCIAKSKQSGQRCRRAATKGMEVCPIHGGKSLKGMASPVFKTGLHSKYMPKHLLDSYHEAFNDPELLNMRHDLALVEARLGELLQRVQSGESKTLWSDARKACDKLREAFANDNLGGVQVASEQLDRLIGEGLTDYAAWNEIHAIVEQRRKLVESEQKRLVAMNQMITAEQALMLMAAIQDIVSRHVTDRKALSEIIADVNALATHQVR